MSLVGKDMDIELELLEKITNKFSEEQKIGSGGYGDVYRAVYNGEVIAVKKLHPLQGLDDKAFEGEFRNLRGIHHENVVRLLGYCYASKLKFVTHNGELVRAKEMERILCFQFMQGGSLDKHISEESCDLDWPTCYRIIKGVCEGINHLHNAQGKPIFHLDLKPANILLDENKTAKLGDLGLSRLIASTETHKTETITGTQGFMPPEYVNGGFISTKFDVFSLGVIILKIMAGNVGYSRYDQQEFVELVTNSWKERFQGRSGSSSQEIYNLQLMACADIALRCVRHDRKKRPSINEIVKELERLESKIKEILLSSDDQSNNLIGQQRSSADSNILAVDPTQELRFPLLEPRKDISCCLQLTNLTEGPIAFNIKTNRAKYYTEPSKGIMPPCSKRYVLVTLPAQEEILPPSNMQCRDMFLVQSVPVSKELTSTEIPGDLFEKAMTEKVVDVVKLPVVYVARDQFTH